MRNKALKILRQTHFSHTSEHHIKFLSEGKKEIKPSAVIYRRRRPVSQTGGDIMTNYRKKANEIFLLKMALTCANYLLGCLEPSK